MRCLGLSLVLLCCGCAAQDTGAPPDPSVPPAPRGWLAARGLDLLDVLSLRLAAGPGLLLHARATKWIAIGAGELGPTQLWEGSFALDCYELGWNLREGGLWTERRAEIGISTFYYCDAECKALGGCYDRCGPSAREPLDIGVEAHLALIGAGVDLRIVEIGDFLAGIAGFDPMQDG